MSIVSTSLQRDPEVRDGTGIQDPAKIPPAEANLSQTTEVFNTANSNGAHRIDIAGLTLFVRETGAEGSNWRIARADYEDLKLRQELFAAPDHTFSEVKNSITFWTADVIQAAMQGDVVLPGLITPNKPLNDPSVLVVHEASRDSASFSIGEERFFVRTCQSEGVGAIITHKPREDGEEAEQGFEQPGCLFVSGDISQAIGGVIAFSADDLIGGINAELTLEDLHRQLADAQKSGPAEVIVTGLGVDGSFKPGV